ncbi:MAG: cysteine desulfurase family protein [Hyphomicrobiales bacterium]
MRAYLDHNATTPVRPEALDAVSLALANVGNPSSVHGEGRVAKALLEESRQAVASLVGARAQDVTFTSGGTEANNLVIKGTDATRLLVSAVEHPAVLDAAQNSGKNVSIVPVTRTGVVDVAALEKLLEESDETTLVSVMFANNETGVIQPVAEIATLAHNHGALVHTDAVQAVGKTAVNMVLSGVDSMTLSAHKIGGPAGVGALITLPSMQIDAGMHGGGQELKRRPGTENLSGIAGFAAAARAISKMPVDCATIRDGLESKLREQGSDVVIFGANEARLNNTTCFAVPGMAAEMLLIALDLAGVAVSSGSACSSGKVATSHVLDAMGVDKELAKGAIRVSFGWNSQPEDVEAFARAFSDVYARSNSTETGEAA